MIYLYDTLENYSDEQYLKHLNALPVWRREKALQYKKVDDRKRSVLAFVLLQHALREEYGITEIPEFVYNEFGKPSVPNLSVHFSLSHCKDAVVCAVSNHNIGIDVENIVPYDHDVARRICSTAELEILEQGKDRDVDFIKLWTVKEAISKHDGRGISMLYNQISDKDYVVCTREMPQSNCMLSICLGQKCNENTNIIPTILDINADDL